MKNNQDGRIIYFERGTNLVVLTPARATVRMDVDVNVEADEDVNLDVYLNLGSDVNVVHERLVIESGRGYLRFRVLCAKNDK